MIILKHLKAERFRLLREVDLHFPQRGSILIAGPNEAGKSTVIESIYFALYGEPLLSVSTYAIRAAPSLTDLVHYRAPSTVIQGSPSRWMCASWVCRQKKPSPTWTPPMNVLLPNWGASTVRPCA